MNTRPIVKNWNYPNFKKSEMDCKCGCGINNSDEIFMDRLQEARRHSTIPFIINSGCRCEKHNATVSKNPVSDHISNDILTTVGADIRARNDQERLIITNALIKAGFRRIRYNFRLKYIHVALTTRNPEGIGVDG